MAAEGEAALHPLQSPDRIRNAADWHEWHHGYLGLTLFPIHSEGYLPTRHQYIYASFEPAFVNDEMVGTISKNTLQ